MLFLYNLGIKIYYILIKIASLKNQKAAKFIDGRRDIFSLISSELNSASKSAWFHFASLGEFEQGRPVIEKLKLQRPNLKIVITFFSPSGYEIRKNTPLADHVFYLPIDTKDNAAKFIELINPEFAIFTKYEYWYHYYHTLFKKEIPIYVVSAIFRKNQIFFKWYGSINRKILHFVTHFFVQDQNSAELLKSVGIDNCLVSGDTRFDRVSELVKNRTTLNQIPDFVDHKKVFIGGSTWPADEELIGQLAKSYSDWKFIIAPHEISKKRIEELCITFPNSVKLSDLSNSSSENSVQTLIIDNIGQLSSLYAYADVAYIGGGFGRGIHNTLEAATYGLPIIFGPNYQSFKEAKDLIEKGAAISIITKAEVILAFKTLISDPEAGNAAKKYVEENTGATNKILSVILPTLPNSQSI